jgi:hypothetical protein
MKHWIVILVVLLSTLAFAAGVQCAYHPYASCYGTGQIKYVANQPYMIYHCSCGDDVLVRQ